MTDLYSQYIDHKPTKAALRESEDRLAEAQRLAHVGSWSVGVGTGTRVWSDELFRLLGHEPHEFEPDLQRLFERLHPVDAGRVRTAFLAQVFRAEPLEDEFRIVLPDGAVRWIASRTELVLGNAGQVVRIHGTAQDVTERKLAEDQLRFQAHLLDAVGEAVVVTDLNGTVIYWAPGAEKLYGWKAQEAKGRRIMDMTPTVQKSYDAAEIMGRRTGGERWAGTMELRRRDNSSFLAQITRTPVFDDDGQLVALIGISSDVSEGVRAEGFRSAVMSQVAEGVYTQDCEGRLTYMNAAASKMLGWTEDELRGKHVHEVVHYQNADGTSVGAADCALLSEGPHSRLEGSAGEAFTRKDGSIFPVAYSALPLRTGATAEGVVVVFRDVSEPGASPNVIHVLIADSDRPTTESFQALLDRHEGIDVVGVATTSASALEATERLRPDVVLVNVELPDLHGLATSVTIKANVPSTKVILMTEKYDDIMAIASIDAGCAGVLDKSRAWVDLVSAVRAAYHGETIISQEELQRVLSKARGGGEWGRATHLTGREEEVLACMREGLSNAMVAERLGVTANTVRNHVQRILYKLNVHSKLEAVVLTSREGLQHGQR